MKGKKSIGSIWPKWPYCDSRFGQYAGCHVFVVSILGFCICILYMWRYFHVWELANTWIIYPGIMLYYGNKKYWIVHNLYWLCHKLWHYIFARVHRPPALIKRRHGCVAPGPIGLFFFTDSQALQAPYKLSLPVYTLYKPQKAQHATFTQSRNFLTPLNECGNGYCVAHSVAR